MRRIIEYCLSRNTEPCREHRSRAARPLEYIDLT